MEKRVLIHALALKLLDVAHDVESEAGGLGSVPKHLIKRVEDILEEIKKNQ